MSDPRNATLIKMFNLINVGERSGSGVPKIFAASEGQSWRRPELMESFEPDRTCLVLELMSEKPSIKTGDKKVTKKSQGHRDKIMTLIDKRGEVSVPEICQELGLQGTQARTILRGMAAEALVEAVGENKNRRFRAKK